MSFGETAHDPERPQTADQAIEKTKHATGQDLADLNREVIWQGIPNNAQTYLQSECNTTVLPFAIREVRALLSHDPTLLSDFGLAELFLPECIEKAEIAALDNKIEIEKATGRELDTSIEGLKERVTGNLTGTDKAGQLTTLIAQVKARLGFPEAERAAALTHLEQITVTLSEITTLFTDKTKRAAFTQIADASTLNLGAASAGEVFAPIMVQVEASGVFSEDDKRRMRDIVNASDLKQETLRQVVNPKTGEARYAYSKDHPLEFRPNVQSFPDPQGREYMKVVLQNGLIHQQEITHMSLQERTALAEYYQIWQIAEATGKSDFLHNSFGLVLDPFAGGRVDWFKLKESRQIVDALLGGLAGDDGKIFSAENAGVFIVWQMQWLSKTGDASQDNIEIAVADNHLKTLGMKDPNGKLNLEMVKAFGNYTQTQYGTGEPSFGSVHHHLFKLYPQFVKAPVDDKAA